MSYVKPQMNIYQMFEPALNAGITPLHACIIGPKYGLHRLGESDEETEAGSYVNTESSVYSYPGKVAGSYVDLTSVEVSVEDADLEYYKDLTGTFELTEDGGHILRAPSLILASANGYSRSAIFGNRDVSVSDKVVVKWGANTVETIITRVSSSASSDIGSADADVGNQASPVTAVAANILDDTFGDATMEVSALGSYSGVVFGYVEDTYTVTVQSIIGSTAYATVISASGSDDISEVAIELDTETDAGTRGLKFSVSTTGSGVLAVGDTFKVNGREAYTAPTLVSSGTYTGVSNTEYIITITQGGTIGTDIVRYKVTTTNGYDVQTDTTLTEGANIVGNYGVVLTTVSGDTLVKGDNWLISASAAAEGAYDSIALATPIAGGLTSDTLSISLALSGAAVVDAGNVVITADDVTIAQDATVANLWTGVGESLPVLKGTVDISYRESIRTATTIGTMSSVTEIEAVLGPIDPANPLSYGMFKALSNSSGVMVFYVNVPSDDLEGYSTALNRISLEEEIWSIVPLTKQADIIDLCASFVKEQSSPINNNFKKGWFCSKEEQNKAIYTEENGVELSATILDNEGGSNYVNVQSSGARFVSSATPVFSKDTLRYNPRPGDNGELIWDTAIISVVISDEVLLLESSAAEMPISTNIEIWRESDLTEYATDIAASSSYFAERRINNIWPDFIPDTEGQLVDGFYVCAALAALRSASAPHAPLTFAELVGFGAPERTSQFSSNQLDIVAEGGTWIITSDMSGAIYTRHQLTTDMSNEETREDSITSNLDSISKMFKENFADVIGRGNVTPDMLDLLDSRIVISFNTLMNISYENILGPQVIGYELLELAIDPVLRSKIRIRIKPELPMPLNYLDIMFYIG